MTKFSTLRFVILLAAILGAGVLVNACVQPGPGLVPSSRGGPRVAAVRAVRPSGFPPSHETRGKIAKYARFARRGPDSLQP